MGTSVFCSAELSEADSGKRRAMELCGERYAGDCPHTSPEQKADLREWEQGLAGLNSQIVDQWADTADVDAHLAAWTQEMPPMVRILANQRRCRTVSDGRSDAPDD
jgi:uncharacterized coiled-coil protein SlyX